MYFNGTDCPPWFRVVSAVSRFGHESFRPWVVSAWSYQPGLFRPDFMVGPFGLIWWVVSAQYPPPPPIFHIARDTVFLFMKSLTSLCCTGCSLERTQQSHLTHVQLKINPKLIAESSALSPGGGGGGRVLFFLIRRLGPSFYHSPPPPF